MTRLFCPHCGNKTLKKVAVTVKDDGSFHLHFSQNPKVLNPRGLRVSAPSWWPASASPFPSSGGCFCSTAPYEKCWAGSSRATLGNHPCLLAPGQRTSWAEQGCSGPLQPKEGHCLQGVRASRACLHSTLCQLLKEASMPVIPTWRRTSASPSSGSPARPGRRPMPLTLITWLEFLLLLNTTFTAGQPICRSGMQHWVQAEGA